MVAWERLTGAGAEASVRDPRSGAWSPAATISARAARDVSVAMGVDGVAYAVWQRQPVGEDERIEISVRPAGGPWGAPIRLSSPGTRARQPVVAVDAAGDVVVAWRRDTNGDRAVVEVVERATTGRWGPVRPLSPVGARARRPRIAMAPDGTGALVWEERVDGVSGVGAVRRMQDGTWGPATRISGTGTGAREPDVAVGATGDAAAVWLSDSGGEAVVLASPSLDDDGWGPPEIVARGRSAPREVPRPGRADTGPDVSMLADGETVAAWTIFDGDADVVATATRTSGSWSTPRRLSTASIAGGAQVTSLAGGDGLVAWEELDHGLIRARVAHSDVGAGPCTNLSGARSETGGVRLTGGAVGVVVFVDLNRGRVQAVSTP